MNVLEFQSYLPYLLILILATLSYFYLRHGITQNLQAVQEKVINAQKEQIETLERKVNGLEKEMEILKNDHTHELMRQQHIIDTTQNALASNGLLITIDGRLVTMPEVKRKDAV